MTALPFFRLLAEEANANLLLAEIAAIRRGRMGARTYVADVASLEQVPGTPFAYWVSESLRRRFSQLDCLEGGGRAVRTGLITSDDFRFARTWWEVRTDRVLDGGNGPRGAIEAFQSWCRLGTHQGKRWATFAKGGTYAPFYADIPLVVNWECDGQEMKSWASSLYGGTHWSKKIASTQWFFRPGFTWSERTAWFSLVPLPMGSIFSISGKGLFADDDPFVVQGICGSTPANFFIRMYMARSSLDPKYQAGDVQRLPFPEPTGESASALRSLVATSIDHRQWLVSTDEVTHIFCAPTLAQVEGHDLKGMIQAWHGTLDQINAELSHLTASIDDNAFRLYGISDEDRHAVISATQSPIVTQENQSESQSQVVADSEQGESEQTAMRPVQLVGDTIGYCVGCAIGRWDIRMSLDLSLAPKLQGPFDPLPVCSPGMLVGPEGLPARRGEIVSEAWLRARPDVISLPPEGSVAESVIPDEEYPLRIDWDGILVDDEGYEDDIVKRARDVLALLWGDRAEAIEQEACSILGVRSLRDYFRNPKGFWDFHVKRYSKSRRKAPIYWLLQPSKRAYGLWLYYPRLDADTLFKALGYVGNRLLLEQGRLDEALGQQRAIGEGDARTRRALDKQIETHETFISEVSEFRTELQRVADLGITVDHDDGVLLSIAPLHNLVPWPPAKTAWNELLAGKYGWSSIGKQLREKGIVQEKARG